MITKVHKLKPSKIINAVFTQDSTMNGFLNIHNEDGERHLFKYLRKDRIDLEQLRKMLVQIPISIGIKKQSRLYDSLMLQFR